MALKLDGKTFNLSLAAFAAGAVASFLGAMPADLFEELIAMSGISEAIAAAEPPLGTTARLAVIAFAGGLVFCLVWALLRVLDPPSAAVAQAWAAGNFEDDWEPARVRRADVHPDAPTRRPIFAGHEFGEPADLAFLSRTRNETAADAGAVLGSAPDTNPGHDPADEPPPANGRTPAEERRVEDQVASRQPPAPAAKSVELVAHAPGVSFPPLSQSDAARPDAASSRSEGNDALSTEALLARLPLPEAGGESIASLLDRLDVSIGACEWPIGPEANEAAAPVEDRLRNVIEDLQKLAARS